MVEIKGLTCGYASGFSLDGINLKIEKGDLVGIIGPNGSGKTTLLRAISRLLKPRKGSILFRERDIWQEIGLSELARELAVVSQSPERPLMKVFEFVLLGRIPHYKRFQFFERKKDIEIAEKAISLTGIIRLRDQPISEISGGEAQLAAIARGLAQEPKLLLLDEPTSHLDIANQVTILDLIKKLNKELNLTVIMVMHDLNLASEYCQKLVLLQGGRIYKVGSPEQVLSYQIIEEVYKTTVVVKKNPISKNPHIFIVPEH